MGRLEKIILVVLVAVPTIAIAASAAYWVSAVHKDTISINVVDMIPLIIGPVLSIFSSVLAAAAVSSKQAKTATALLVAGIVVAMAAAIVGILAIAMLGIGVETLLPPIIFAAGFALLINIMTLLGATVKSLDIRK